MAKNETKSKKSDAPKVKKVRKERAKMRSRKDSPAGHLADRLAANQKQRNDIFKAAQKFPGVPETTDVMDAIAILNRLADQGFKPAAKRGGRTAVMFTPGQKVTLAQEARDMLRPQIPDIDTAPVFVASSYSPVTAMKSVPVRRDTPDLNGGWVGFVSRGFVSAAA